MLDDIFKLITKVVPDTNEALRLQADIQKSYDDALVEGVKADKEIKLAEMQSDAWLQRSWRPPLPYPNPRSLQYLFAE